MRPIIGVVHKDEGSAYGVSFPDAPGCFAAADELDGLIPAAVEALTLWAEEGELPVPRDMEEIRAEVADELLAGAALVAVPLVVRARVPRRVNVSLDRGVLEAIDAEARRRGMTRSAFLAEAALNEIEARH